MTYENMFKSERFRKILERAEYSAGENVPELVSIVQKLIPEIERELDERYQLFKAGNIGGMTYSISMKDIENKVNERHYIAAGKEFIPLWAEIVSTEALFLIFSSVAWHNPRRIIIDINTTRDHCLALWFRFGEGEEPSVESCATEWMTLYQEA